jgi:heme-degrading monooxygenase HmoA
VVLEVAILDIKPGMRQDFELAFACAQDIISSMPGYIAHELQQCVENANRYLLLVNWATLEDHTVGFRGSEQYRGMARLAAPLLRSFPGGATL